MQLTVGIVHLYGEGIILEVLYCGEQLHEIRDGHHDAANRQTQRRPAVGNAECVHETLPVGFGKLKAVYDEHDKERCDDYVNYYLQYLLHLYRQLGGEYIHADETV